MGRYETDETGVTYYIPDPGEALRPSAAAPVPAPASAATGGPPAWLIPPQPAAQPPIPDSLQQAVIAQYGGQAPQIAPFAQPQPATPTPASQAAPVEQQAAGVTQDPSVMSQILANVVRGNQQVIPGGFRRVGYQVQQQGTTPLPGADLPERGPSMSIGVEPIDRETFAALPIDQQRAYLQRLESQRTAPIHVGPERVDPAILEAMDPEVRRAYEQRYGQASSEISSGPAGYRRDKKTGQLIPIRQELSPTGEPVEVSTPYGRATQELGSMQDRSNLGEQQALEDRALNYELADRAFAARQAEAEMRASEIQDEQQRRAEFVATEIPKLEALLDRQREIRDESPIESWRRNTPMAGKLSTVIGLALTTLGSALTGTQNVGLELLNKQIDSEVMRQRKISDNLGQQFAMRHTLFGDMLQQFRTPEAAEAATRYHLETAAYNETRRLEAKAKSDDERNRAAQLKDQIDLQRAASKKQALEGAVNAMWADVPARVVGQKGGINALAKQLKDWGVPADQIPALLTTAANHGTEALAGRLAEVKGPKSRTDMQAIEFERRTRVVVPSEFGGGEAWATDAEQKKAAQEGLRQSASILKGLQQLRKIAITGSRLSPTDREFVKQLSANSMGSWRVNLGLGVMSESDKELIQPLTGGTVNNFQLADRVKVIDNVENMVRRNVSGFMGELYADPNATKFRSPQIKFTPEK